MEMIYTGSVKDIYQGGGDDLVFKYSNRYSIFDWGQMPDEIPLKGQALAAMAWMFFDFLGKKETWSQWTLPAGLQSAAFQKLHQQLSQKGLPSHFISFDPAQENSLKVKKVQVLRPPFKNQSYDYAVYAQQPVDCLVPLEVIFRRALGTGNSLVPRLRKNPEYARELGLNEMPAENQEFARPLVEFSTKLESTDRYLSRSELKNVSYLAEQEESDLRILTQLVAERLAGVFASRGARLWDGKFEYAFLKAGPGHREFMLVDSIGPDELRITFEGLPLSKEFLRQIYTNSSWATAVKKAKEIARERGVEDWKSICVNELHEKPRALTVEELQCSSRLYQTLANELALAMGYKKVFAEAGNLSQWNKEAQTILEKNS